MKRGVLFVILLLVCLPSVFALQAWNFRMEPRCDVCWEGALTNTSLEIFNIGDQPLRVIKVALTDPAAISFFSSSTDVQINPGGSTTFNFMVLLPPPTRGFTLFYRPCIFLPEGEMCSNDYSRMLVKPLSELECFDNNQCGSNEICTGNKCLELACEGRVMYHICYPPEGAVDPAWIMGFVIVAVIGFVVFVIIRRRKNNGLNMRF